MKKLISLILATLLICLSFAGCGKDNSSSKGSDKAKPFVGTVVVELDAEAAPITVENFVKLAKSGFYDGLSFHRIMKDFMMQGGGFESNGTVKDTDSIYGEFAINGWDNPISHTRGVISMARSNDPDSASGQFFIVHQNSEFLDGSYAAFGHVTEGMNIVDVICENIVNNDGNGGVDNDKRPIMNSVKIVEKDGKTYAEIEIDYSAVVSK